MKNTFARLMGKGWTDCVTLGPLVETIRMSLESVSVG